jgi:hypothetical protein
VFAQLVRYEVGQAANAEPFVDAVMAEFDGLQAELPALCGSFLLTRRDDGEALALLLWDSEDDAAAAANYFMRTPAPDTGAREVVTGRRPDRASTEIWDVWQGRQLFKTG